MIACASCGASNEDRADACASCGQPPATSDPRIGRVLAGRYEIRELLGRGGMGVVYKAYDRLLEEPVAIKLLRGEVASPELARRFRDEIRFARRVSHRNVCRIHEYGESGALRFISMAFVDGIDLKHVVAQTGPLPPAEAIETGRAVAAGLQAIHDEGIIHRDLKTANIMRDAKGVVRLMDFGIAKDWSGGASSGQTATGVIVGTPEYMSPEQAMGRRIDARSDIYALGVVMYELLTGRVPFRGETPMATLLRHIQEPLRLDTAEAAGVPEQVRPILACALAKSPDDRFASASAFADALAQVQGTLGPLPATARDGLGDRGARTPLPLPTPTPERLPAPISRTAPLVSTPRPTPVPAPQALTHVPPATEPQRAASPRPADAPTRLLWPLAILGPVLAVIAIGFVTWRLIEGRLGPVGPEAGRTSIATPMATAAVPTRGPTAAAPTPIATVAAPTVAPTVAVPTPVVTRSAAVTPAPRVPTPAPTAIVEPRSDPAAQQAWEAVARAADDPSRPEAERIAELKRFIASAPAGPHSGPASQRLALLELAVRTRIGSRPDPSTLGRQRKATYMGGTLHDIAEGTVGTVAFPDKERMVLLAGAKFAVVPFQGVSGLEYGLTDRMRGIVFKKKSHYLSVTYKDPAGETQGMVIELDGEEFRPVLTMLEARTGRKVQYQDEKAAKERWK